MQKFMVISSSSISFGWGRTTRPITTYLAATYAGKLMGNEVVVVVATLWEMTFS